MQLVILDRDGVINEDSDAFIKSVEEFRPLPGSLEAIARLTQAGWCVVVATNQSGLARGLLDIDTLSAIHEHLNRLLAAIGGRIEAYFFCPHAATDGCRCRKPRTGMLEEIGERLRQPLAGVPMVGDSARDLDAARAVGGRPVLVRTGKGRRTEATYLDLAAIEVHDDLRAVANVLLGTQR